jgi:hypothetical protein
MPNTASVKSLPAENAPPAPDAVVALRARSSRATRVLSFAALCLTIAAFAWVAHTVYRAATDSFVAPAILSPDNDLVLASKLRLSELLVERGRAVAEVESLDAEIAAAEGAVARLEELRETATGGLRWMDKMASVKSATQGADLAALEEKERTLRTMLEKQRELTDRARQDLQAGIISRDEYALSQRELAQVEVALLENGRTKLQARSAQQETELVRQDLSRAQSRPSMPELIARREQLVRVELEVSRLQAEARSRRAQLRALQQRIDKIDELSAQLRSRPIYQAAERKLDLAFVPYTQLEGVAPGAHVYDCVWGIFACERVGRVTELVPGEVILPDPWGTQTRGQYAVLALDDHAAARSKVLRVRPAGRSRGRDERVARAGDATAVE